MAAAQGGIVERVSRALKTPTTLSVVRYAWLLMLLCMCPRLILSFEVAGRGWRGRTAPVIQRVNQLCINVFM